MKKLNILKRVLNYILYLSIIGVIGIIILFVFNLSGIKLHIGTEDIFKINRENSEVPNLLNITAFLKTIAALIYVYCIYLFRKVIIHFCNKDFFNNEIIKLFDRIGKLILAVPFINIIHNFTDGIIVFISNLINNHKLTISFEYEIYLLNDSLLITISLGFLFMILSEVFKTAKELKEENDLTV